MLGICLVLGQALLFSGVVHRLAGLVAILGVSAGFAVLAVSVGGPFIDNAWKRRDNQSTGDPPPGAETSHQVPVGGPLL